MLKLLLSIGLATVLGTTAALAGPACGARADVVTKLAERFKEAPAGIGLASNGGLMELLTADDGATWTLIMTMPNGQTCLLAAGEDWQPQQLALAGGPEI